MVDLSFSIFGQNDGVARTALFSLKIQATATMRECTQGIEPYSMTVKVLYLRRGEFFERGKMEEAKVSLTEILFS